MVPFSTGGDFNWFCASVTAGNRGGLPWPGTVPLTGLVGPQITAAMGGDPRTAFILVPNERKSDIDGWLDVIASVERGHVPAERLCKVELTGSATEWVGPKKKESAVFITCGRNVEPARLRRCLQSLVAQTNGNWGAVVLEDASTNGIGDYAEGLLSGFRNWVTLVTNRRRRRGFTTPGTPSPTIAAIPTP